MIPFFSGLSESAKSAIGIGVGVGIAFFLALVYLRLRKPKDVDKVEEATNGEEHKVNEATNDEEHKVNERSHSNSPEEDDKQKSVLVQIVPLKWLHIIIILARGKINDWPTHEAYRVKQSVC